jgi:hypothetical protein
MAQVFHPSTNSLSKVSLFGAVFFAGGLVWLMGAVNRSPYVTREGEVRAQPVPFSHKHHVAGLGIDCRYCHVSVEDSASAGIPPTKTCMSCHSQVWTAAAALAPIQRGYELDEPIVWTSVHRLPEFARFHHGIHVSKGVACETCHGRVDRMPLMVQAAPLTMAWCLECHRDPAQFIRPREEVFTFGWQPPVPQSVLGPRLVEEYDVQSLTYCSVCHR